VIASLMAFWTNLRRKFVLDCEMTRKGPGISAHPHPIGPGKWCELAPRHRCCNPNGVLAPTMHAPTTGRLIR
ncbi:MAG: hypothetical protein K0U93_19590, partial [Gammaproteobacteria bacterium]|nr:hypothetical protein [Gammaproteobacteria bacterium]